MSAATPNWSRRLEAERQRARRRQERHCVYFVRMAGTGPIKIGMSRELRYRLDAIQCSCPYKVALIARIDWAGKSTEGHLHRLFGKGRLHGEWFAPDTPGLLELVAAILRDEIPEYLQRIINIDRYGTPDPDEETRAIAVHALADEDGGRT